MSDSAGVLLSVNVGRKHLYVDERRTFTSAIGKTPASGTIAMRDTSLVGDDIADNESHGGPERALYAYAVEDYAWWANELGRRLAFGLFGENLTTRDLDVSGALVGERWRIGEAVLRVTSPRIPCFKLAHVVGEPDFVKRFAAANRPGAYLAIEREAEIGEGDAIEILDRPDGGMPLATFVRIYFAERTRAAEILAAPNMTDQWRAWAASEAAR